MYLLVFRSTANSTSGGIHDVKEKNYEKMLHYLTTVDIQSVGIELTSTVDKLTFNIPETREIRTLNTTD